MLNAEKFINTLEVCSEPEEALEIWKDDARVIRSVQWGRLYDVGIVPYTEPEAFVFISFSDFSNLVVFADSRGGVSTRVIDCKDIEGGVGLLSYLMGLSDEKGEITVSAGG